MHDERRSTFQEFCEVSTCMGVVDLYHAKNFFSKLFWAIVLIASLSLTLWQTQGAFCQFMTDHPYKVAVSKERCESGIQYPNLIICNYNRVKQSFIDEFNIDPKVLTYAFQFLPTSYAFPLKEERNVNITEYEYEWNKFKMATGIRHPLELYRRFGHTFEETMIDIPIIKMKHEEILTINGLCWKLIPNRTEPFPEAQNSIKLFMNPNINEYMTDVIVNNYVQEGMIIIPGYINEPLLPSPLYLSPVASKHIEVRPDVPIRPPVCQSDTTLMISNEAYTMSNCVFDCYLISLWKKCGCILLANTKPEYPLCNLTMATYCAQEVGSASFFDEYFDKFERIPPRKLKEINEYQKECISHCRSPCEAVFTVTATLSTTKGTSRRLKNSLSNYLKNSRSHGNSQDFIDNLITADIYFSTSVVTVMELTETTPIFTFIGEIGGHLGLWVGVSMLTLIQCLYYFVLAVCRGELFPIWKNNLKKTKDSSSISYSFKM